MVLNDRAGFPLAERVRSTGAPIGDVFAFVSGLYFRGKLAYSRAFEAAPPGVAPSLVITPGRGLLSPDTMVGVRELREIAAVPIHEDNPRYREALDRDARAIAERVGPDCAIVLLGSIATAKYVAPLLDIFGERLLFPIEFVGRGDMSRGGIMLRCAEAGSELTYVPVLGATRKGQRPPRLPKLKR